MRIAVIGTRGIPDIQGGIERHCESLYPRLCGLGCDVTVYARTPYRGNGAVREYRGVKVVDLWCPRSKHFETITHTFWGVLSSGKLRPDIVHFHGIGPALAMPACKALSARIVLTHHGPDYQREKWGAVAKAALKAGERLGVLLSDRVIAVSRGIRASLLEKYGRESAFIPNGVEAPSEIPADGELRRWGVTPRKYAFTAARIVPEKGLTDLIDAYRSLSEPPFKLVIAGEADHESAYSISVRRMAAATKGVVLTGFLSGESLSALYAHTGLFVLPSYYEGQPLSLLEAMSYGLPVLVSDIPPHRELHLEDGRYFKAGNVASLALALQENYARGIGEDERIRCETVLRDEFSWDSIAERTFEVYRAALA